MLPPLDNETDWKPVPDPIPAQLRGAITVTSRVDHGSTFRVSLPLEDERYAE